MQKGYKRTGKGIAVLHFFIGLIILAIVVFAIYFFVSMMDYSDRLTPETSMRPYVEVTAAPEATETPAPVETVAATEEPAIVDISGVTAVEETPVPTEKPTPAPTAIVTPAPTPIATATPEPTKIPKGKLSEFTMEGFQVPAASDSATVGLTNVYASVADNNQIVQLQGYGYINDETFDGAGTKAFVIVTQRASGKQLAYKTNMAEGISGADHSDALCANAASTDFECYLDVKSYPDGEYELGVVLNYKLNGQKVYSYHEFGQSFTVKKGAATVAETAAEATESFG